MAIRERTRITRGRPGPGLGALLLIAPVLGLGCGDEPAGPESPRAVDDPAVETALDQHGGGLLPFSDLAVFMEFNSTDNDLGVQVFLDAEDWERIRATGPGSGKVLEIVARGGLKELGLTELRFESAEPSPSETLALVPPGPYLFTGRTTEGDRLAGTAVLSHDLAPPPVFSPSSGEVVDPNATVIRWNPIPGVAGWEVIVSNEDGGQSMEVELPAWVTQLEVPPSFMDPGTEYKAEVLAILPNGNKTITEGFFSTSP